MGKFRIYYDDGSTYEGDPYLAPPPGVIIIAIEAPDERRGFILTKGKDSYYYRDGRWYGCDEGGFWDYMMIHIGPKAVVFGRTIRDDKYWKIIEKASKEGINGN